MRKTGMYSIHRYRPILLVGGGSPKILKLTVRLGLFL